ncbi:hypothetical protein HG536_0E03260 [Torulaspora globosa]|uniref:Large ribosomal subunit protein mL67 n=1 Tax=Torulaspora globosa TaxID=48254 RepID=A0A7G3ZIS9_9SACH|nr:uncharacterized protein HG536_0E03260 [Torulaspora globosa]QLL33415.1 hypothetical protein HG536_0E03260 [Torulaspora globosa]
MTGVGNLAVRKFRPASWLQKAGYAPQVFVFRNLESGQVVYSQFPNFTQKQVDTLFQRPNWENKKPSTRRDVWKCMCVVDMPDYESSVKLYQNLRRLRYLRDVRMPKEAQSLRKKNDDGNVWYSAQYRPTYAQEAVADLIESLSKTLRHTKEKEATLHWEDPWRMGDKAKYWSPALPTVKHTVMSRLGNSAREQSSILRELGEKAKQEFLKFKEQQKQADSISL